MQNHLAFAKDMLLPMADEHNLMSSVCNRRGCASCMPSAARCAPPAAPVWRVVRSAQRRFVHAAINKPKHDPNFACMWMPDGCQIVTGALRPLTL